MESAIDAMVRRCSVLSYQRRTVGLETLTLNSSLIALTAGPEGRRGWASKSRCWSSSGCYLGRLPSLSSGRHLSWRRSRLPKGSLRCRCVLMGQGKGRMKQAEGRKGLGASRDFLISACFILPSAFGLLLLPSAFQQDRFALVGELPLDAPQLGPQAENPAADFAMAQGGLELRNPQRRGGRHFGGRQQDRLAGHVPLPAVQGAQDGCAYLVVAGQG